MIQLALVIVFVVNLIWFYPHCVRPSLQWAGARRSAFGLGAGAGVVSCCAFVGSYEASEILHGARGWIGPLMAVAVVAAAIDGLAWARPEWIVQLTGGPDPLILASRAERGDQAAPLAGPLLRVEDVRRFASRSWVVALAALAAQLTGELGTAVVRAAVPSIGTSQLVTAEHLIAVAFGVFPGAIVISRGFAGRWLERAESVAMGFALLLGYSFGAAILVVADMVLRAVFGPSWTLVRGDNHLVEFAFRVLGSALVLTALEFFVWVSYSSWRTRVAWKRIWQRTAAWQSDDRSLDAAVRGELVTLRRSRTAQTRKLSGAVEELTEVWLAEGKGTDRDEIQALSDTINREATALYGAPVQRDP